MCEHVFVRWRDLTVEHESEATLPGFKEPAVVRTFDAPEAIGTRFYEIRARSAINKVPERSRMPFRYTINPYRGCSHACAYCFARPTHTYLDFNAREDFEREIVVKVNAPELVRAELGRPSWRGDHVALGTNTDPYQWVEGRYRLMEGIWEAMRDFANPCSVLTKSPLLLRDIELMKQLVEVTDFAANLSVPTLDEKAWRADRAAHSPPAKAAGGGRRAEPGGDPDRRPDRAADAGRQRRARAGGGDPRAGGGGGRPDDRRRRAAPARRGARDLVRLAARSTGPISSRATRRCMPAAPICPAPSGSGSPAWPAADGA